MVRRATRFLASLVATASVAAAQAPPIFREDFDGPEKLSERWQIQGEARATRQDVPPNGRIAGVAGKALFVDARPGAKVVTKKFEKPAGFGAAEKLVFRVNAERVDQERPLVIEVWGYSGTRPAWRWRRVTVEKRGWTRVEIPLREFLFSPGGAVPWAEVERLVLFFRGSGSAWFDGIELSAGAGPASSSWGAPALKALAFPDAPTVRTFERAPFVIVTDSPDLDGEEVLDALTAMAAAVKRDFPTWPTAREPVPLLIFADEGDYRDFWPKLGPRIDAVVPRPEGDGFTALGLASSSCALDPAKVRAVYVHEANHALMQQVTGLAVSGEWFFEGLACRYQVEHSREPVAPLIRRLLDDPKRTKPLEDLLAGKPIGVTQYWQALSVVDWLLEDPERRDALVRAIEVNKAKGTADLRPQLAKELQMSLAEIDAAWQDWAREKAGRRAT